MAVRDTGPLQQTLVTSPRMRVSAAASVRGIFASRPQVQVVFDAWTPLHHQSAGNEQPRRHEQAAAAAKLVATLRCRPGDRGGSAIRVLLENSGWVGAQARHHNANLGGLWK
jgi:hypothetical protein